MCELSKVFRLSINHCEVDVPLRECIRINISYTDSVLNLMCLVHETKLY